MRTHKTTYEARLVVNANSLVREGKALVGEVYFETDAGPFPANKWTDFTLGVLVAWIQSLLVLSRGVKRPQTVDFFDGPYHADVARKDERLVSLQFMRRGQDMSVQACAGEADLHESLQDAIRASAEVLAVCERRGFDHPDVEALRKILKRATRT